MMEALFEDDSNYKVYTIFDIGGGWYSYREFPVNWGGCVCDDKEDAISKGKEILESKNITEYKIAFKEFNENT